MLWAAINAAIALKTGNMQQLLGTTDASSSLKAMSESSSSMLLRGSSSVHVQQLPVLLLSTAVSPAGTRCCTLPQTVQC